MPSQPTRFPYGLSLVKPWSQGFNNSPPLAIQNSSSTLFKTPDITNGSYWLVQNSGQINNFLGGEQGRLLYIQCKTGGAVVLQNSIGGLSFSNVIGTTSAGSTISFTTANNITMLANELLGFIHDGTGWSMIGTRFVLSTQV